jgi:hypothetical protein
MNGDAHPLRTRRLRLQTLDEAIPLMRRTQPQREWP